MKNLIYLFFKILGIRVTKFKSALKNQQLIDNQKLLISKLNFILTNTKIENTKDLGLIVEHSKSQISQDIFVLDILNLKKKWIFCRNRSCEWSSFLQYISFRKTI